MGWVRALVVMLSIEQVVESVVRSLSGDDGLNFLESGVVKSGLSREDPEQLVAEEEIVCAGIHNGIVFVVG